MSLWEVIVVAIGLALDSVTVTICRGSNQGKLKKSNAVIVGIIFGVIQTLMLIIGMLIAIFPMLNIENQKIISMNQWFSAIILFFLAFRLFKNSFLNTDIDERREEFFGYKASVTLALATSIDAFMLGVGLGLLQTKFVSTILIQFIITAILVASGLWVGYCIGNKYKKQIDTCGGIILLSIGIKVILNYFQII
ncbi:manganese efflux pump [Clostridium sp. NSJ-6]|uniref:Manganese efflux pump n=1 Tax=Clostridium hominis TaxID=2763036 RepID=A0ABR7DHI8_9CLOT|nr:manganese efflux pump [Clostridium hominis]MBC5630318.1 manganese efflux pump [Clostridium hominis]MDU2673279.1 manganese efflux pump [Clostridium sp.]